MLCAFWEQSLRLLNFLHVSLVVAARAIARYGEVPCGRNPHRDVESSALLEVV